MRDQAALRVDHVGVAALADLDLRDHVPDQLEIDLGDAHAGVASRAGNGERHVRLGFAAEIDRSVIDLARCRFRELGIIGKIGAAADHVHGQARHPQPLLAGRVELRQLGNGGHLAQQPQRIEAALLDRARRPRQLRRPAELALDLLDELADLGGGGFRLLALDADERRFVLLIVEEHVENAIGQQSDADHRDEQRDVFGEQAPAGFCDGSFGRRRMRRIGAGRRPAFPAQARNEIANPHPHHCTKLRRGCVRCWDAFPAHANTSSARASGGEAHRCRLMRILPPPQVATGVIPSSSPGHLCGGSPGRSLGQT